MLRIAPLRRRRVAYIVSTMPLQSPQLLKPYLPDGPIQKSTVDILAVAVNAKSLHTAGSTLQFPLAVIFRRVIVGLRAASKPRAIQKQRYILYL